MVGTGESSRANGGRDEPFFSGGSGAVTNSYGVGAIGPGARIGPFQLLGILGEGGYGVVYLAQQEQPIRRRVALKVIKPGMDSRQVIARFEAERQALALLDHPHIAHVYDAGTTPEGRPYFAMEYIEGLPITEYCDRQRLMIRERLRLFQQVCSAVQHAHQKGIIHRDLKPSNILVTGRDGEARIRVIDFGIAKALAQTLTDKTLYTEQGQLIGTPDYMSPEQAEMDAHGIDTRSDVYTLGVVLYELLTGVLPFDPDALRAGGVDHIRTMIREQEPRTPSTRLTGLGEETKGIAERRQTDLQTLAKSLRHELEWIPLKAMRKEAARRYQSVYELARDVENYLQDRPLLAGPESLAYRAKKTVRRHVVPIMAAGAVLLALVTGLIVSTQMYFTAERARRDAVEAETAEQEQRRLADSARVEAEKRLADLYESQGRGYLASGELDKALVFLSEAYQIDSARLSVRLSLLEGLRKHGDPNFRQVDSLTPWQGIGTDANLPFCVSPSRALVAFVDSQAHMIYVQRTDTGGQVHRLSASNVLNLAFTPDDRHIIAKIHKDQGHHIIRVFDLERAMEVISIERRDVDLDSVQRLAGEHPPARKDLHAAYKGILIPPTAHWFAFIDVDGAVEDLQARVCLWDFAAHTLRTQAQEFVGQFLIGIAYHVPAAPNGSDGLLVLDRERVIHFVTVPDLQPAWKYPFGVTSGTYSREGTRYMAFAEQSGVILADRTTGNRTIKQFPTANGYGFSPDGRYAITERAAAAGADPNASLVRIDVWDSRDGRYVIGLTSTEVENLYFTPDSKRLVTEHHDQGIRVWSLRDFVPTFEIPGRENRVVTDLSTDGRWLLTCRRDDTGTIRVYDLESGRSFAPHECRTARRNLSDGWADTRPGRIFSSPYVSPQQLPLFNGNGSRIITGSGLWTFTEDSGEFRRIPALVAACVPLRLEQGSLLPVSPGDLLRAKVGSAEFRKGSQVSEVIRYQLQIAEQQRLSGRLDEALEVALGVTPWSTAAEAVPAGSSPELFRKLFEDLLSRGDLSARQGRHASAVHDYRAASKLIESDPRPLKALAWLLATCPDAALRNSREAMAQAQRARGLMSRDEWEWSAIYAAACAADGNWPSAVTYQEKALRLLPHEKKSRWLANYEERLRHYQSGRRYERQDFLDLPGHDLVARWDFEEPADAAVPGVSVAGRPVRLNWNVRSLGTPRGRVLKFWDDLGYADCGPLTLPEPIGALTVIAWGKWDDVHQKDRYPIVVSWGHSWDLRRTPQTGTMAFQCAGLNVPASAPYSRVYGQIPLANDGRWHHFAGVYDGNSLRLYVDGILDGASGATGAISSFGGAVWVGLGHDGWTQWKGMLDDVRLYAVSLNAEEIAGLYNQGKHRYKDLFYVDAGQTRAIAAAAETVRLRARVTADDDRISADRWRFSWALSAGPGSVQFVPRSDIPDPCAIFSGPGLYALCCTVEKDGRTAHDTTTVVVFPGGFGGLVAHYTFDEGDARDSSGQGIDGKLKGDACIVNDVQRGSVLQLDGAGDYVDCGADPRFDVNEVVTVAAWVKAAAFDREYQALVTKGDSAWGLCRNGQSDRLRLVCGGMEGFESWPGPVGVTRVNDRKWHHVAGVCDGRQMYLYIDGRQDSCAKVGGRIRVNREPVYIGGNAEEPERCWNGWIDEVRIYNRALSAEEVTRLYAETK